MTDGEAIEVLRVQASAWRADQARWETIVLHPDSQWRFFTDRDTELLRCKRQADALELAINALKERITRG